jgi:hypothetical protein
MHYRWTNGDPRLNDATPHRVENDSRRAFKAGKTARRMPKTHEMALMSVVHRLRNDNSGHIALQNLARNT